MSKGGEVGREGTLPAVSSEGEIIIEMLSHEVSVSSH